jgi:uncharacterized protein
MRPRAQETPSPAAPVLSAEVFVIPLEEAKYLMYAPLRQAAFVANARVVLFLADLKEGRFNPADDPDGSLLELLRRLEILDAGEQEPPASQFSGPPRPTSLTLFLTTTCNLRCTYCYASAGDTPAKSMRLETAMRGIDFVAANAVEKGEPRIEVNYHGGGEPTANWSVMTESLAYAREKSIALGLEPPNASSATNGVLRDDQVEWIIANLDGASVSFDGLPEVHDTHRLTVLGQGSSARVMATLRRFDAAGFPYGIRVTVTADQIPRMPESVAYICANFAPRRIQVEPAYQLGRWRDAPSAETEAFINGFRAAQAEAAHFGREIFFSAARLGVLSPHFCGITQDSFALSPDGNVSACYEVFSEDNPWAKTFFYGRPNGANGGYEFNLQVLERLRRQTVDHRDFCRGCFARWTCAGDCYHKSLTVNGEGEFRGSDRCHITRELTKDQILAQIAASGGLFWHEERAAQTRSAGKEVL